MLRVKYKLTSRYSAIYNTLVISVNGLHREFCVNLDFKHVFFAGRDSRKQARMYLAIFDIPYNFLGMADE